MVGDNGIYLLYRMYHSDERGEERRLVGRFVLLGGELKVLEDHDGICAGMFQPGPLTSQLLNRMEMFAAGQSPYWRVYLEAEVQQGQHDELVEELKLGPEPWPAESANEPAGQE